MYTLIRALDSYIKLLPRITDNYNHGLCQEIFSISTYTDESNIQHPVGYRSIIVHFGLSVKDSHLDLQEWISKYMAFLKGCPNAFESFVNIKIVPLTATFHRQHLSYRWHKQEIMSDEWHFEGDPVSFQELSDYLLHLKKKNAQ